VEQALALFHYIFQKTAAGVVGTVAISTLLHSTLLHSWHYVNTFLHYCLLAHFRKCRKYFGLGWMQNPQQIDLGANNHYVFQFLGLVQRKVP